MVFQVSDGLFLPVGLVPALDGEGGDVRKLLGVVLPLLVDELTLHGDVGGDPGMIDEDGDDLEVIGGGLSQNLRPAVADMEMGVDLSQGGKVRLLFGAPHKSEGCC
ncbi:hypothetical protein ES703_92417 [subsurface metagenome]